MKTCSNCKGKFKVVHKRCGFKLCEDCLEDAEKKGLLQRR